MQVKFYAGSGTSHCGKSQTFTLEQLGLQDYEQWLFDNIDGGWSLEDD